MAYVNPLTALPSVASLLALPSATKLVLADLLWDLRKVADDTAEKSWRKRKGPVAAYWRAVATYAGHTARLLRKSNERTESPTAPTSASFRIIETVEVSFIKRAGMEESDAYWRVMRSPETILSIGGTYLQPDGTYTPNLATALIGHGLFVRSMAWDIRGALPAQILIVCTRAAGLEKGEGLKGES